MNKDKKQVQNVEGALTNAVIKPARLDNNGIVVAPAFIALTFKCELSQFSDAQLGNLLISAANEETVDFAISVRQLLLDLEGGSLVTEVTDELDA